MQVPRINYLLQLNAFFKWKERNQCSHSAQLLWFYLMMINQTNTNNNGCWEEWFYCTNGYLVNLLNISENSLNLAKKELEKHSLIKYVSGKRGCASKYYISKLYDENKTQTTIEQSQYPKYETITQRTKREAFAMLDKSQEEYERREKEQVDTSKVEGIDKINISKFPFN